jgi:hypothetical protein
VRKASTHEDFSREQDVKGSSNRTFGIVFTVAFAVIGALPYAKGGELWLWALAVAALFLIVTLARPSLLGPLNRLWLKFGLLLHKVVTPVVMALLFFFTVTPVGLLMRLTGKDPMYRRFDPAAKSYWIMRVPPGPAPDSMRNQF